MQPNTRFTALDVFRGMTVCFMIVVNNQSGAKAFAPLEHAAWNGFTPTDLVFPAFLFAVGNAMAFTMPRFKQMPSAAFPKKILKRTFLIFLIGYLLSWFPFYRFSNNEWNFLHPENTRIFGVLQRIALCFGIAAFMIHYLSKKSVIVLSTVFLLGYWLLLYFGGDYTMLGNLQVQIDKWMIGESHMYKGEGVAFEPEGFLSTFPAVVNVVLGYYTGVLLKDKGQGAEGIMKVLLGGVVLMCIAYCWNYAFPINKKLWTSSFVLYTSGISMLIIGVLVYVLNRSSEKKTEEQGKGWIYFFEVFGKNPLFIYVLSGLIPRLSGLVRFEDGSTPLGRLSKDVFQSFLPGSSGALAYSISLMMVCWLVGYWMDSKKIYLRV
jgi:predicted acyltransferase